MRDDMEGEKRKVFLTRMMEVPLTPIGSISSSHSYFTTTSSDCSTIFSSDEHSIVLRLHCLSGARAGVVATDSFASSPPTPTEKENEELEGKIDRNILPMVHIHTVGIVLGKFVVHIFPLSIVAKSNIWWVIWSG
ncbi:hypothetical protein NE237_020217 [Protea cynaroides]|uniref:Uncharacterized protein n=1 Tax=Protea cynaroides TaxID=273540 RepID=A0A9Q0H5K9_9MAGN|nr:hypothetical protein NE237_020217 [Protea cynaroides]